MNLKFLAAGLVVSAIAAALSVAPADAATKRKATVYANSRSPNASYMVGPRTRIYVSKRSWLDSGTEVLPGERHYTDYVIPPNHVPGQTMTGPSAPSGWQNPWYPMLGPFDAPNWRNW